MNEKQWILFDFFIDHRRIQAWIDLFIIKHFSISPHLPLQVLVWLLPDPILFGFLQRRGSHMRKLQCTAGKIQQALLIQGNETKQQDSNIVLGCLWYSKTQEAHQTKITRLTNKTDNF